MHAIKKLLSKYVWSISVEKISFIRSCDVEAIKVTDFLIKVPITSGNIKWCSFALRFCASIPESAWQPLPSAKGLSFTFISYPYARVMVIFHLSFLHFILWQAHCVGKILIYIYPIGCKASWTIIVDITLEVKGWEANL